MRLVLAALLFASLSTTLSAGPRQAGPRQAEPPSAAMRPTDPLAHTYSIVARDPATGDFGVAVQSHWFQVGPIVPWAEAGVGAVATQSFVKVDYGPRGAGADARAASRPQTGARPAARRGRAEGRPAGGHGRRPGHASRPGPARAASPPPATRSARATRCRPT